MKLIYTRKMNITVWLVSLLLAYPALAQEKKETPYQRLGGDSEVTVWLRGSTANSERLLKNVTQSLPGLKKHSLFKDLLPAKLGILLDGEWTKSSGFWADTLKDPDGNQAILITPSTALDATQTQSLIVHELMHLVHHSKRPKEASWVREGLAMMAEYRVTGNFPSVLTQAFQIPETTLTGDFDPRHEDAGSPDQPADEKQKLLARYGHVLQFFYYLHRLCGGDGLLAQIETDSSEKIGIEFMDELLKSRFQKKDELKLDPVCADFDMAFTAFQTARFKKEMTKPSGYVLNSTHKTVVRDASQDLPEYSAMAYKLPTDKDPPAVCPESEQAWGASRCIKIRKK